MSRSPVNVSTPSSQWLCPACALCCDGAIFRDVELQAGDDAPRLQALGLRLGAGRPVFRFPQPCAALDGCRCSIYAERPARCRQFDCALLQSVEAGRVNTESALRHIRQAHRLADRVRALLLELGDTNEGCALSLRCQRTARRLERSAPTPAAAAKFADLTLAWHALNRKLERYFHPGSVLLAAKARPAVAQ
jgi:hypothetical protein